MKRLLLASTFGAAAALSTQTNSINSSGNVGIGTLNPERSLQIGPNATAGISVEGFENSPDAAHFRFGDNTGWKLHFGRSRESSTGGLNTGQTGALFTIQDNGNVGIGTTSPTDPLTIGSLISAPNIRLSRWAFLGQEGHHLSTVLGSNAKVYGDSTFVAESTVDGYRAIRMRYDAGITFYSYLGTVTAGDMISHERVRITPTGNVGIGTSLPSEKLTIYGAANSLPGVLSLESSREDAYDVEVGRLNAKNSTAEISRISFLRGNGSHTGYIAFFTRPANESPLIEGMRLDKNGNLGLGTTNPTHKLAVNGTIKTKEVIVETTGWSDYVFADDYALQPLAEVEAHIKTNKHLPGIPSAAQVATEGISIGEMQAKLLAKIEELTLHQITQEKILKSQASELKAQLAAQAAELTALRSELHAFRNALIK